MSNQDLFKKEETVVTPELEENPTGVAPLSQTDYNPLLGMIVNKEGEQKYKSVEDALKGASHATSHIANLEQQVRDLESAKDSATNLDAVIKAIESKKDNSPSIEEAKPAFTEESIKSMVESTLQENTLKATRSSNIEKVIGKFETLFGDKASETMYGKAEELGMNRDEINQLISTNPTAVFKMLGVSESTPSGVQLDLGSTNSQSFNKPAKDVVTSSMGFVSGKKLTENWLRTKERVLKTL